MKRKSFTLVEILVVIAVITILMGLLFPALGMVKEKAYMRQSLSDVKAIHMAIKSFKNDYGFLPFKPGEDSEKERDVLFYGSKAKSCKKASENGFKNDSELCKDIFKSDDTLVDDYFTIFNTLCFLDRSNGKPPTSGDAFNLNSKKVKFLTPPSKYSNSDAKKGGYRDPWGRPYLVFIDADYDGKIILPGGKIEIYDDAAIVGEGSFEHTNTSKLSDLLDNKNKSKIVTSWQ